MKPKYYIYSWQTGAFRSDELAGALKDMLAEIQLRESRSSVSMGYMTGFGTVLPLLTTRRLSR